jgi:hypothetical protein
MSFIILNSGYAGMVAGLASERKMNWQANWQTDWQAGWQMDPHYITAASHAGFVAGFCRGKIAHSG